MCKEKEDIASPSLSPIVDEITSLEKPTLVSPENNLILVNTDEILLLYTWNTQKGVKFYNILVSDAPDFSNILHNYNLSLNKINLYTSTSTKKIYWKVKAVDSSEISTPYSEVFEVNFLRNNEISPLIIQPNDYFLVNDIFSDLPILKWKKINGVKEYQIYSSFYEGFIDNSGLDNHNLTDSRVVKAIVKADVNTYSFETDDMHWNDTLNLIIRAKLEDGTHTNWTRFNMIVKDHRALYFGSYKIEFIDRETSSSTIRDINIVDYYNNGIMLDLDWIDKKLIYFDTECANPVSCIPNKIGVFSALNFDPISEVLYITRLSFSTINDTLFLSGNSAEFSSIKGYKY